MTSIKPPAGPLDAAQVPEALIDALEGTPDLAGAASIAANLAATGAAAADTASAVRAASVGGAAGPDALGALAASVERGELSLAQALERVIGGHVDGLAAQLSELDRADLTALLRHALAYDPTFASLRDDRG